MVLPQQAFQRLMVVAHKQANDMASLNLTTDMTNMLLTNSDLIKPNKNIFRSILLNSFLIGPNGIEPFKKYPTNWSNPINNHHIFSYRRKNKDSLLKHVFSVLVILRRINKKLFVTALHVSIDVLPYSESIPCLAISTIPRADKSSPACNLGRLEEVSWIITFW